MKKQIGSCVKDDWIRFNTNSDYRKKQVNDADMVYIGKGGHFYDVYTIRSGTYWVK